MQRKERLILISMCLSLASVVAAMTSLNVALPDIARATGASTTQLQWIIDAYSLVFASLLLPAGALGDRLGRRRVLLAGLTIFGVGALIATQVNDAGTLIAIRAVMGIGAALTMPTTLSIITSAFSADSRDRAVGVWAGVAGGAAIVGGLASGLLLEWFSWPSVFSLSAVLAAVAIAATLRFVPSGIGQRVPIDAGGAVLSALGLTAIVWGFIEGPSRGWTSPTVAGAFAAGGLLLVGFVLHELRRDEPMLDPRLFALRGFGSGSLSIFTQFFALFGVIFVVLQYLQFVLGYSPLQAAAALAPASVTMMFVAPRTPRVVERFGMRRVGPLGLTTVAAGLVLASTMGVGSSYWMLGGALALLGLGVGMAGPPATTAIVTSLPDDKQGVASAVNDTAREVGGALGIAVLGSVLASHVGHMGPHMDPQSLVDGYQAALRVGAAALVGGAAIVFWRAPRSARRRTPRSIAPASTATPTRTARRGSALARVRMRVASRP